MKLILNVLLCIIIFCAQALAYFPVTRIRNFVNDKNNGVPITASYMDAELNQLVTAVNSTGIVQSTAPTSPTNGQLWFDTTNNVLKEFRFNEWVEINPVHGHSVMATPQNNDLWVNNIGGQDHLKIYDINGVNWNDIPTVPKLNGVNWQLPIFNGVNWQDLNVYRGINWSSLKPILFNGVNWDDPSYSPATNRYWQYQGFGNTPQWIDISFSSPPPIGSVTPNTGGFTTLTTTGNVGIGTTTNLNAALLINGHLGGTGNVPSINSCNFSTIASGSTDFRGSVNRDNSSSSNCSISFSSSYASAPFCVAQDASSNIAMRVSAVSTSGLTMTGSTNFNNGDVLTWICIQ